MMRYYSSLEEVHTLETIRQNVGDELLGPRLSQYYCSLLALGQLPIAVDAYVTYNGALHVHDPSMDEWKEVWFTPNYEPKDRFMSASELLANAHTIAFSV